MSRVERLDVVVDFDLVNRSFLESDRLQVSHSRSQLVHGGQRLGHLPLKLEQSPWHPLRFR
jgi:hypothetical protein